MSGFFSRIFARESTALIAIQSDIKDLKDTVREQIELMKMKEKNLNDVLSSLEREQERNRDLQNNVIVLLQAHELSTIRKYRAEKQQPASPRTASLDDRIIDFLRERGER